MALRKIEGSLLGALGMTGYVQAVIRRLSSTGAVVAGVDAHVAPLVLEYPDDYDPANPPQLEDGPWRFTITSQVRGAQGFPAITFSATITADTSWGALVGTASDEGDLPAPIVPELRDAIADLIARVAQLEAGAGPELLVEDTTRPGLYIPLGLTEDTTRQGLYLVDGLVEDTTHPGLYVPDAAAPTGGSTGPGLIEDPDHPGLYIPTTGSGALSLTEDPLHPGLYLIGA